MLLQIFSRSDAEVAAPVAFIAGDRQSDGIFNLWSIASNVTIRSLRSLLKRGLITSEGEDQLAAEWKKRMGIRTSDMNNNILTLSGGNQQKTLFARALGSEAKIILMDDPMRGVDIGTKLEVYEMIAREAKRGHKLPIMMPGGEDNPLGARAMYLHGKGGDTGFRIHGTREPWTIGLNVSSGCIRLNNNDVVDLYDRARVGAKVIVL